MPHKSKFVTSSMDPDLMDAVLNILSHAGVGGLDAYTILQKLKNIEVENQGVLYKCLRMLVMHRKLVRIYSVQKGMVIYKLRNLHSEDLTELQTLEHGSHVIAVYPDKRTKFDAAFQFLKTGLERNEIIMLVTDDMSKEEIRSRMAAEFQVNIPLLETRGDIVIKSSSEWYFPDGSVDIPRIISSWSAVASNSITNGKNGVRVFGDVGAFFERGFKNELVEYETSLEARLSLPLVGICAYESEDAKNLTLEQLERLQMHHEQVISVLNTNH